MSQIAGMRDLAAANRTHLLGGDCDDRSRLSREGYELDLISLTSRIDMHYRSGVARFETLPMQRRSQNHSVVFLNHESTILKRVRCDQSRNIRARVDNPDGSNRRGSTVWTRDWAINSIFGAVLGCGRRGNRMCPSVNHQSLGQDLPVRSQETEPGKELCLARPFWVVERKEIIGELGSLDECVACVWKRHGGRG